MNGSEPKGLADVQLVLTTAALVVREKRWFWGTFLLCLGLGVLYLNFASKQYEAALFVAPADIGGSENSRLAGAAAGVASSLGISLGGDTGVSAFDQFINTLSSPDVARKVAEQPGIMQRIFAKDWDAALGTWRENPSFLNRAVRIARLMLNRPQWSPPTPERLADYISKNVSASKVGLSNIYRLTYKHSDPGFSRQFLNAIYGAANDLIRQQYVTSLTAHTKYLSDQLNAATVAEVRLSLSMAIVQDQRLLASASSGLPFAARSISAASARERPVAPSTGTTAVATLFLGSLMSFAVAHLARRRRPST